MGWARLPDAELFPRGRSRRPLRDVGVPGAFRLRAARGVQATPVMKTTLILGAATLIAGAGLVPEAAAAQQPGTKRTELQRHDLSIPGREVIQVRVDFDPGYVAPKHTHFGQEIIYFL